MYVAALCVARTAELLLGAVYIYAKKTKALYLCRHSSSYHEEERHVLKNVSLISHMFLC